MEKGKITLGLPIYNEEKKLSKTLDSIMDNIDDVDYVLISDNNSNDSTPLICEKYCKKHEKLKYYRNSANIGSWQNMMKLLKMVKTEYYMQLGGHDSLPRYSVKNLKAAMKSDIVCCFGKVINQIENYPLKDTYIEYKDLLESEKAADRVVSYLLAGGSNRAYYGIMRTERLKEAVFFSDDYKGLGVDNLIVAYMALKGKLKYIPEVEISILSKNESTKETYRRYREFGMELPYINPGKTFYHKMMKIVDSEEELKKRKGDIKRILRKRYYAYPNNFSWVMARSIKEVRGYMEKVYSRVTFWGGA